MSSDSRSTRPLRSPRHDPLPAVRAAARLAAVERSQLLHEPAGEALTRLTRIAARILDVPGALINILTDQEQVTATGAGPDASPGAVSPLGDSFCRFAVATGEPFVVEDARDNPLVRDSAWTRDHNLRAYAGMPLEDPDGQVLGSFCVFDQRPREWSKEDLSLLADLAAAAVAEIRWRIEARERQQAEAENRRLLSAERAARADAEAARCEAEHANQAKSQFLAIMSHELRTPLNAIGGYADLLEMGIRGPITEAQRSDLQRIRHSQQHLLSLINDLLNFAKLEAGRVEFDLGDVAVAEVLASVEGLIGPDARTRGLVYTTGTCPTEVSARADRDKLEQILLNLVSNAIKFTDPPGAVEVRCETEGGEVRIQVRDTGIGIEADKLDKIFDPFIQADPRLARARPGTGLGLAISRDLARGMGGEIRVESTPGAGSVFTLTLPRAAEQPVPSGAATPGMVSAACRALLDTHGVHAVLGALNARTPHRFTGLYRFDAPMLRNIALFDREAPQQQRGADTPMRETYCSIVGATQKPFGTPDTAVDVRVADHPARDSVISYCGVLVRDAGGQPLGTLCHFDMRPQPVPTGEIPVMEAVAPMLAGHARAV